MYLLNNEYDIRKSICKKLYNKYKTHDFKGSNQSYTSIATALFRKMRRYLPESSYNVHTRQILDDNYPRALQWCTFDDISAGAVNKDICKCYPNILLNNNMPVPVCSIHDVIEPVGCKNDLELCGEFYIDETEINNFGTPIVLEAG